MPNSNQSRFDSSNPNLCPPNSISPAHEPMTALPDAFHADTPCTDTSRPAAAIAILYQNNRFLLQLRDDFPNILYPGHWAFFGGHVELGESPNLAMQRELAEEIGYIPPQIEYFCSYVTDAQIVRHVFHAPLNIKLEKLQLNEGQDLALSTIEEVHQGYCFSTRLGQSRPLATPHRQILLDFLQRHKDETSFTNNGNGNGKNL